MFGRALRVVLSMVIAVAVAVGVPVPAGGQEAPSVDADPTPTTGTDDDGDPAEGPSGDEASDDGPDDPCAPDDDPADGDDTEGDSADGEQTQGAPTPAESDRDAAGTAPEPGETAAPVAGIDGEPLLDGTERLTELVFVNGRCITVAHLRDLLDGYEAAVADEAEALVDLRDQLDTLDELHEHLDVTDVALAEVIRRVAAAEVEIRYAEQRAGLAADELDEVSARLDALRERLRRQAIAAYVEGNDTAASIQDRQLDPDDFNEFGTIRTYGRVVVDSRLDQIELVAVLEAAAVSLRADLDAARERASNGLAVADRARAIAEVLRTQQEELIASAEIAANGQAELVADIQQRRDEFAAELGLSTASSGNLGQALAALDDGAASLADVGRLASPLATTRLGSGFGPRLHPIFGEVRPHLGLDLSSPAGAPIFAVADGTVVVAGEEGGYGLAVAIDHGDGIATLYAHMSAFAVDVGGEVAAGDIIGFVGSTGYSTGPHLHFELRLAGLPVDPLPFVDLRSAAPPSTSD